MKNALFLILLILLPASVSVASPLIFKTTKTIQSETPVEITTLDTTKYSQLRILVINQSPKSFFVVESEESWIYIDAIDGSDYAQILTSLIPQIKSFSSLIDTPPNACRIRIKGFGKFKVFIWAS